MLKPCPVCGKRPYIDVDLLHHTHTLVCRCPKNVVVHGSASYAIKVWNEKEDVKYEVAK